MPEPVSTGLLGPLDTAELRDTVSYATLHMMERLSPPERAVFVLREAFGLPYGDIAEIVGTSVTACRQMHHRAGDRLAVGRDRFHPSSGDHARLLTSFLDAAASGDLTTLTHLLSEEVTVWNDGGGEVRAALRPVVGRDRALVFLSGLVSRYPIGEARLIDTNGEPAIWITLDGRGKFVNLDIRAERIHTIFAVLNPDKLGHLRTGPRPSV